MKDKKKKKAKKKDRKKARSFREYEKSIDIDAH